MSYKKTMSAIIAGAVAGAIAGILLAPDRGAETRKKLTGKAGDVSESVKSTFSDFIDSLKNTFANATNAAEDMGDDAAAKVNTMKGEVKNEVQNSFS
jgi:gas vesicle protein